MGWGGRPVFLLRQRKNFKKEVRAGFQESRDGHGMGAVRDAMAGARVPGGVLTFASSHGSVLTACGQESPGIARNHPRSGTPTSTMPQQTYATERAGHGWWARYTGGIALETAWEAAPKNPPNNHPKTAQKK